MKVIEVTKESTSAVLVVRSSLVLAHSQCSAIKSQKSAIFEEEISLSTDCFKGKNSMFFEIVMNGAVWKVFAEWVIIHTPDKNNLFRKSNA